MKKTQLYAREGVAFDETVRVRDTNGQNIDLTGYSLTLEMFREIGDSPVFTLATDAAAGAQGLHIVEGGLRVIIDKATLNGIADDTGEFDLFGDLRGDEPGVCVGWPFRLGAVLGLGRLGRRSHRAGPGGGCSGTGGIPGHHT